MTMVEPHLLQSNHLLSSTAKSASLYQSPMQQTMGPTNVLVITNAHAQDVATPTATTAFANAPPCRRRQCRQQATPTAVTATATANNNNNDDNHGSISSVVLADMMAEEAADQLWDDAAIDADIAQVIKNRIAPNSRTWYNDYTVRFIIFLFDQRERFPDLIRHDLLDILCAEHLRDVEISPEPVA